VVSEYWVSQTGFHRPDGGASVPQPQRTPRERATPMNALDIFSSSRVVTGYTPLKG
jgi:hypothetical protein